MENLFQPAVANDILNRIEQLNANSQPLWGKMNVAQMMAHCTILLRIARGIDKPKRRLIGILLGWAVKDLFFGTKPFPKNSKTDPTFIVNDRRNFENEKQMLIEHIKAFFAGGPAACTTHPNPFFGKLKPEEWARSQFRHRDHHLKQFGV